jgi:hypothetical protein
MSPEARERSFDELASGLASGTLSRRRALRLMGAALVGGTLASLGIGEAAADDLCKPPGKKCRKNAQCCSGKCEDHKCAAACTSNGGSCTADSACCSGICDSGTCATCRSNGGSCTSSSQCCGGNCSNGTCSACPPGTVELSNGTCARPCTSSANCAVPSCGPTVGCVTGNSSPTLAYCSSSIGSQTPCTTDSQCPPREFCSGLACRTAC